MIAVVRAVGSVALTGLTPLVITFPGFPHPFGVWSPWAMNLPPRCGSGLAARGLRWWCGGRSGSTATDGLASRRRFVDRRDGDGHDRRRRLRCSSKLLQMHFQASLRHRALVPLDPSVVAGIPLDEAALPLGVGHGRSNLKHQSRSSANSAALSITAVTADTFVRRTR